MEDDKFEVGQEVIHKIEFPTITGKKEFGNKFMHLIILNISHNPITSPRYKCRYIDENGIFHKDTFIEEELMER